MLTIISRQSTDVVGCWCCFFLLALEDQGRTYANLRFACGAKAKSEADQELVVSGVWVAQYHCHVQAISRAPTPKAPKGRSAVAAAAYRSGDKLHDEHSTRAEAKPITHDYTRRSGVVHAEIVLPVAAPDWARERQELWNRAEAADRRKNSTLAREVVAGLPWELSDGQRVELARAITLALVDRYGFAADFAVHRPSAARGDDPRNQHVHILCTTRVIAADGFGSKTRVLDSAQTGADEIRWIREMVARMCNEALARAGIDASVDHRSLIDQRAAALAAGDDESAAELDRPATKHRGPAVEAIVRDERESYVDERITSEIADKVAEIGRRQAAEVAVVADIDALDIELVSGREELADIERQVAEALREIAEIPDVPAVLSDVKRLWRSLERADGERDERRASWPILRLLDLRGWTPDSADLRDLLDKHPELRRDWVAEISARDPEIRAATRERAIERVAAREYLVPVPVLGRSRPAAEPEPEPEPEPVARRDLAPLPAVRTVRDVDDAIADAEARLAALEQRERVRAAAAEAYQLAQSALQAAQSGLWARLRAWVGLGASPAEHTARAELTAAEQGVKSAGAGVMFGKVIMPADAGERSKLKQQIVALRDERRDLIAADATTARRAVAAVDKVIELVKRADRVVPGAERAEWPALRALDAAGGIEQLRERLQSDPGFAIALAHDLGQRLPALEALELEQAQQQISTESDTQTVLKQIDRLWRSLDRADGAHDARRDSWSILSIMDRESWTPAHAGLRALLERSPDMRRSIDDEITARAGEIRAQIGERSHERLVARLAERRAATPEVQRVAPVIEPVERRPVRSSPEPEPERRDLAPLPPHSVVAFVARLDAAIERDDPRRPEWAALRLLDAQPRRFDQPQLQLLAAQLEREPAMTAALVHEISQRADELAAIEAELRRIDEQHDDDQAPGA